MSAADLAFATAGELAHGFARGAWSPVEAAEACLERIERVDPALGAFVAVARAEALEDARRAEREIRAGRTLGPLHGVPVAIKDLFDVAGSPTRAGSKILADAPPAKEDAHAVACLRRAGAVFLGKLALHEFAFGITNTNPHTGTTRNPWNLDRVPGGSSGGSGAALAAGLCTLSIGTDTGGSIRIPAAACGVCGLKPTFGRVGRSGVLPLAWSMDHVGPMARDVADLAAMLETLAAPDPRDPAWDAAQGPFSRDTLDAGARGLALAVPRGLLQDAEPEVASAVEAAIETLVRDGAERVEVALPGFEHAYTAFHTMLMCEAAAFHRPWLASRPGDYGADVRRGLDMGSLIAATDYVDTRRLQAEFQRGVGSVLERASLIVTPTLPRGAPPIGEPMSREPALAWNRWTAPFNLAGVPTLSIPCGFDRDGLPVGLQLAGRWRDEATVLRAGAAFQRATDWHRRRPPLLADAQGAAHSGR